MEMAGRKQKGRKKIEIKRIEDEDNRLISFSKRKSGAFNKASELAILCGAEIGLVVFSPTGKPFSFGHPSIDSVANRLSHRHPRQGDSNHLLAEAHRQVRINELNEQYRELVVQLEAEMKQGKELRKLTQEGGGKGWWETPLEGLSFEELQHRIESFGELRSNLLKIMAEKFAAAPSSSFAESSHGNQFATSDNGATPSAFPPGYGYGGQLF